MAAERKHFAYIWQYQVDKSRRDEFLAAYASDGVWARLFSRDPAYIETILLQDADDDDRFMTIDYWASKAARDAFRQKYAAEFSALDELCEKFTRREDLIGDFVVIRD